MTITQMCKAYGYHKPAMAIANTCHRLGLTKRSTQWPKARKEWLKDHPACAACGHTLMVQVHHKKPFHIYRELELDQTNFITLCECSPSNHHLHIGHLGDWKNFNPNVEQDAANALQHQTSG
jgi:hypothetical protein